MTHVISPAEQWYRRFWLSVAGVAFACWFVTTFQLLTIRLALQRPAPCGYLQTGSFASAMVPAEDTGTPRRSLERAASLSPSRPRLLVSSR
jgi:hypothetical protein